MLVQQWLIQQGYNESDKAWITVCELCDTVVALHTIIDEDLCALKPVERRALISKVNMSRESSALELQDTAIAAPSSMHPVTAAEAAHINGGIAASEQSAPAARQELSPSLVVKDGGGLTAQRGTLHLFAPAVGEFPLNVRSKDSGGGNSGDGPILPVDEGVMVLMRPVDAAILVTLSAEAVGASVEVKMTDVAEDAEREEAASVSAPQNQGSSSSASISGWAWDPGVVATHEGEGSAAPAAAIGAVPEAAWDLGRGVGDWDSGCDCFPESDEAEGSEGGGSGEKAGYCPASDPWA